MNLFEACKEIPARDAAELYGLEINRDGFAHCPFHADKTASMSFKYDHGRHFYCFSCHAGGDAVKLTELLFNLSPLDAAKKLSRDFRLRVPADRRDVPAAIRQRRQEQAARKAEQKATRERWSLLCDLRREADQRLEKYLDPKKAWDDPSFVAVLAARAKIDLQLEIEVMEFGKSG